MDYGRSEHVPILKILKKILYRQVQFFRLIFGLEKLLGRSLTRSFYSRDGTASLEMPVEIVFLGNWRLELLFRAGRSDHQSVPRSLYCANTSQKHILPSR